MLFFLAFSLTRPPKQDSVAPALQSEEVIGPIYNGFNYCPVIEQTGLRVHHMVGFVTNIGTVTNPRTF